MNRQPELELLPAARAFGLGVVPYSPIARGVLTGKYRPDEVADPGSRAGRRDKRMLESEWRPESLRIAAELAAHAERRGTTLAAWACAWVLNNRAITSIIAGPRTFEQWTGYLDALDYSGRPRTRSWPTAWCRPATRRLPASRTRRIPWRGGSRLSGEPGAPARAGPRTQRSGEERPRWRNDTRFPRGRAWRCASRRGDATRCSTRTAHRSSTTGRSMPPTSRSSCRWSTAGSPSTS